MKTLLLLTTLAICFQLSLANYKTTTPKPKYTPSPTTTPKPTQLILTIEEYALWASLAKFVPPKQALQQSSVLRFCECKKPFGKRSLMTRIKRQGGKPKKKKRQPSEQRVRKEWRRMTAGMRKSFIKHFNNLSIIRKNETKSRLTLFAEWLGLSESPGFLDGPAFLPWNREFLYRFENLLYANGYTGGLPYWNSGLDVGLVRARDSAIFSTTELGISHGNVGKPLKLKTVSRNCEYAGLSKTIQRFANEDNRYLLSREKVQRLPWDKNYFEFVQDLERVHGGVHIWFGPKSSMIDMSCMGFDPMFYLTRCYIDYLWEEYRKTQTVQERENDYPTGSDVKLAHQKYRTMWPFDDKLNIDGLKNQYTSVFYRYEKSPDTCRTDKACKSALLWCNNGRCRGKIKKGGHCDRNLLDVQCYCAKGSPSCPMGMPPKCACE